MDRSVDEQVRSVCDHIKKLQLPDGQWHIPFRGEVLERPGVVENSYTWEVGGRNLLSLSMPAETPDDLVMQLADATTRLLASSGIHADAENTKFGHHKVTGTRYIEFEVRPDEFERGRFLLRETIENGQLQVDGVPHGENLGERAGARSDTMVRRGEEPISPRLTGFGDPDVAIAKPPQPPGSLEAGYAEQATGMPVRPAAPQGHPSMVGQPGFKKYGDPDVTTPKPPPPPGPSSRSAGTPGGVAAAGNAAALGVDLAKVATAIANGDEEAALASGGSAAVNATAMTDDVLAAGGRSSGNISRWAGRLGQGATIATTAVEIARLEYEGGADKAAEQSRAAASTVVGMGAGWAAGGGLAAGVTAAGLTGTGAAVVASGGTILVAAAASAAVVAADRMIDSAMYGDEDGRFGVNIESKKHLVALANGKFRRELVDPATGTINWKDPEVTNRLATLLSREVDRQEQKMKDNSSYLPRWIRSGESVVAQQSARAERSIAMSAQEELKELIREQQRIRQGAAFLGQLDRDGTGKLDSIADLDRDGNGRLTFQDRKNIEDVLGNGNAAHSRALFETLKEAGVTFDGAEVAAVSAPNIRGNNASRQRDGGRAS